jgi:hypothetical protein
LLATCHHSREVRQFIDAVPEEAAHSVLDDLWLGASIDDYGYAAGCHGFDGGDSKMFVELRPCFAFIQAGSMPEDFRLLIQHPELRASDVSEHSRSASAGQEAHLFKVNLIVSAIPGRTHLNVIPFAKPGTPCFIERRNHFDVLL